MKNPYKTIIKNLGLTYKTILGESSAKTIKGESIGYLTGIVYLKPDHKICAMAKLAGCMNGCLESAGRGAFNSVQKARIAKTRFYYDHQQSFLLSLAADVWSLQNKAKKLGFIPLVRPNGTSDIPYENLIVHDGKNIFELFPDVQFYDYTKTSRGMSFARGLLPANYHVTFSRSDSNSAIAARVLRAGGNVAVVVDKGVVVDFSDSRLIDGDLHDARFLDGRSPDGRVVVLRAKGSLKGQGSEQGFCLNQVGWDKFLASAQTSAATAA